MRTIICFILITCCVLSVYSQTTSAQPEILSVKQTKAIFTDSVLRSYGLNFPIFRTYKYSDKMGVYYCVLTESVDLIIGTDTSHHKLKAVNFKSTNGKLSKTWEINDNVEINAEIDTEETSIWFWTKYSGFLDYDGDGVADPIIVYGTGGIDGGRIKILVYYKGKKYAIRHQNHSMDGFRKTTIEKSYYELPKAIRLAVKEKMKAMVDAQRAIFTDDGIMNEPK